MQDSTRQAIEVESIFYEAVIDGLVETYNEGRTLGASREELLYMNTLLLMQEVEGLPRLASIAAMLICLLAEARAAV